MKILTLNYEYPPVGGGGATVSAQLCSHLVHLGHEVDVITMCYRNLPSCEQQQGVTIYRTRAIRARADLCRTHEMASYLLGAKKKAIRLAKKKQYDIVHAHFIIPTSPLARWIRNATGIPYVVTCHGSDVPGYNPDRFSLVHKLLMPWWKKLISSTDQLISPSSWLKQLIQKRCPEVDIQCIPNGFNQTNFDTTKERTKSILLCSRLLPRKGFQYAIQAIKEKTLDWQINIIGDGPYKTALEQLAEGSKIPIRFWGWLDREDPQLKELYETSEIFIFPSEAENFPTVLLEAMSAGPVIITSNVSGCPEVVGNAALLVPPRDPEAIATNLLRLINDASLRQSLRQAGLDRVQEFSWQNVTRKYLNCFEQVINKTK